MTRTPLLLALPALVLPALVLPGMASAQSPDLSPDGYFVTVDDGTGAPRGLVELKTSPGGELEGFLRGTFVAGEDMSRTCVTCRDELLDQPLYGLRIVYGLEPKSDRRKWKSGRVVDPESGDTYKARVEYSDDFREVELRGYIGTPLLGRSQTWRRATEDELAAIEAANAAVGLPPLGD